MRWYALVTLIPAMGYFATNALGQTAAAPSTSASSQLPRLAVAETAVFGSTFGSLCTPTTGDVRDCATESLLSGLRLSPRWRLSNDWAVGISGGVAWLGGGEPVPTRVWDVQVAGRYYLGTAAASQYWLDAGVGAAALEENWPRYETETQEWFAAHTFTSWAAAGSLAVGRDFAISRYFGLAPEIRIQCFGFSPGAWGEHASQYRPQVFAGFGLSAVEFGFHR